jgi:hypothetical protein
MPDGLTPNVIANPNVPTQPNPQCDSSGTVTAPDGSIIHVPHTVTSMGDRLDPSTSCSAPQSGKANPSSGGPVPLKVIGVVRARVRTAGASGSSIANPSSGPLPNGRHENSGLIVRDDGSADARATIEHYKDLYGAVQTTFGNPTTVQNHALSTLSPDPIQKTEGLAGLGHDAISAAPTIASAAPGVIANAATSSWSALSDFAMTQSGAAADPAAAQRTVGRIAGAGSVIYGATLAPLISNAATLGATIGNAPHDPTAAQDLTAAGIATGAQAASWFIVPARVAGAAGDVALHAAGGEAEHLATTEAEHAATAGERTTSASAPRQVGFDFGNRRVQLTSRDAWLDACRNPLPNTTYHASWTENIDQTLRKVDVTVQTDNLARTSALEGTIHSGPSGPRLKSDAKVADNFVGALPTDIGFHLQAHSLRGTLRAP